LKEKPEERQRVRDRFNLNKALAGTYNTFKHDSAMVQSALQSQRINEVKKRRLLVVEQKKASLDTKLNRNLEWKRKVRFV
jgi:hypothetical protein